MAFITQSYFVVPKDVRLNPTHYFIMKILSKREVQQIVFNYSCDIIYHSSEFNIFMYINNKCTNEPYLVLVNDTTLSSNNPVSFRCNQIERI